MKLAALGNVIVTTAGTPVPLTANQTTPALHYGAYSFMVEAISTNVGKIYLGASTMVKATGVDVFAVLAIPTANMLASFTATVTAYAPTPFFMENLYLDSDVNGEGALVTALRSP